MGWYSIVWEGRDVRLWAMGRCWSRRPTTSTFSTTLSCAWGGSGAGGLSYRGARWRLKAALHARSPRIGRIVREAQAKVRIAMLVCVHIYVHVYMLVTDRLIRRKLRQAWLVLVLVLVLVLGEASYEGYLCSRSQFKCRSCTKSKSRYISTYIPADTFSCTLVITLQFSNWITPQHMVFQLYLDSRGNT